MNKGFVICTWYDESIPLMGEFHCYTNKEDAAKRACKWIKTFADAPVEEDASIIENLVNDKEINGIFLREVIIY